MTDPFSCSDFPYEGEENTVDSGFNVVKSIDRSGQFASDLMKMFHNGSFNDVCIKLQDGEVKANKSVLAARCEYFAATFRWKNNNNHEVEEIVVNDCSMKIMTRIMKYLFSGILKMDDLSLLELLRLRDQIRKMLPGDELGELIQKYLSSQDSGKRNFRKSSNFFPTNEEIVKTYSLDESGNPQMLVPEEIGEILELSNDCKNKIRSLASFAYHGVLPNVAKLSLCSNIPHWSYDDDSQYRNHFVPLDLGFVSSDQLQALVPCVTDHVEIINVTGYDVTSLLDLVNCTKLHLTQKLNQEETESLVRAMSTRVDEMYLGGRGILSLDVDTLTQYKGDGKCSAIHCLWNKDTREHLRMMGLPLQDPDPVFEWIESERIEQWARRMNWSVTKYMSKKFGDNGIYKMYLQRTKNFDDNAAGGS